jgi:exosortase
MEKAENTEPEESPLADILSDMSALWRKLPHKSVFFVGAIALAFLFHLLGNATFGYVDTSSAFEWAYNAYNAKYSEDGHGNLIPFAVMALLVWKRKELAKLEYQAWWPGLVLLVIGLGLHVVGFIAQQTRISILGMFVALYGLMGFCWGLTWLRATFFPYILFLFCVPIGSLAQPVTFPLRVLVSTLAAGFSDAVLQIDVVRQGTLIMDANEKFTYDVAAACSGIRSLMTLVPLTLAFGFIAYQAWWKRILLILLSVPLAVAGNTLRIILVIIIGDEFGQDAGAYWEQKLGFVTFLVAILGIFALDYWLKEPEPAIEKKADQQ